MASMHPSIDKLNEFLNRCKNTVKNAESSLKGDNFLHFVTGNQASDADSMISALVYAYHKSVKNTECNRVYVPVMPIPRNEFFLRCETVLLFEKLGIRDRDILFADEVDLKKLLDQGKLKLILTDHNKLSNDRTSLSPAVEEILDHHVDEKCYPWVEGEQRTIAFNPNDGAGKALVGSCCTLVAEKFQDKDVNPMVATLLLSPILLDTVNLLPQAKKVTERDITAFNRLCMHSLIPRTDLFNMLEGAKFDEKTWHSFSACDCLKYDYKQFTGDRNEQFGCSSILIPIADFINKEECISSTLGDFARKNNLLFLLVMSMVHLQDGTPQRQMLAFSSNKEVLEKLAQFIKSSEDLNAVPLNLPSKDPSSHPYYYCWNQLNTSMSRKQVVPLMYKFLQQ